ncbi:hypothetical protein ACFYZ9_13410 [Streptomyces sp. NPDC001691]|uniref:hypothetical protein n=1 Tax=unclassified Streptomyces TaxID=2593676 RepID=UPI000DEBA841|nr:hypothetical protein [Streptomyces sp. SDr-06]RCH69675.1 hypothetical protein DT019_07280 [Streptomyces sp. SDr-06]
MNPKVNIVVVVDVIGALSDGTLRNGNLCMVDDGSLQSTGQGTPELCTVVQPGQVVTWSALAVDLQTPVEIKNITFLGPDGEAGPTAPLTHTPAHQGSAPRGPLPGTPLGEARDQAGRDGHAEERHNPELEVWSGVVPYLAPGVAHPYRLEVQMYEGEYSTLHIASPALMCP